VIVVAGAPLLAAVHAQTKTIPIVFVLVTDPVKDGFVASLAWPGGNITGFTIFEHTFAGKWLEMLKEVVPKMARVAVMQAFRIFAQTTIWQNSPHPYERDAALRRVERAPGRC
jgi:ABC-type uncharacterized transport system substrate-binding protein